ncbi:nucleotidyl transferase AbiEii/AbiGii toxin family protein [Amycolatopsis panacis]|uniref:nucleotidyl transferase AbiEii/AbiGii toxin family protein n=1 Tax=Amycolatopsis panacis TaxID=2340917 RepID=UPI0018F2D432|nr:nucleotidyl transferase AbiEii/AbiGii toxin family protein [Amycolatopsis panacis]
MSSSEALTPFQVTVAQMFFELPESDGFLLAGGAALVAQRLTNRPTQDLDFFASPGRGDVPDARDAFEATAAARGWQVRRIRDTTTFCRLVVTGPDDLVLDLALDAPPHSPPTLTFLGPTFNREELAGKKVIALFDRAEARDFTDVYALSATYPKPRLLALAEQQDPGFDISERYSKPL